LSLGIDPLMLRWVDAAGNPIVMWRWADVVLPEVPAALYERYGLAQSCAGMSLPVQYRQDGRGGEFVEPTQFVAWARGKGFALPPELDHPAAGEQASRAPATPSKPTHGRPGRKRGSGSIDDESDLRRMLDMLGKGLVPSVLAAATAVASDRPAAHSVEADIRRLRTKFSGRWGTEPPPGKTWHDVAAELPAN
jgi:hypothetical protein